MSDGPEEHGTQSPAELAATLAQVLADAVPDDALRRREPEAAFSAVLTWRHVGTGTGE